MTERMKKPAPAGTGTGSKRYKSTPMMALSLGALNALCNTEDGGKLMGFVEMGIVLNNVELQPAQKMILMALADRADAAGVCWPSIGEIAHRTCQSERTVLRHIATLKDMGLLTLQQSPYRTANGDTRQASNVYHLNLAGMLAGSFDSRPKREKTSSSPGCQTVTLESELDEKLEVNPGCQSDSLGNPRVSDCAIPGWQRCQS
ncbi:helix-turn-helix domain-containing protein [Corynebacterium sp. P5848]|uniref:helix-turn-helix domain-containing protein n=1 Tax=Corynebacterium marambiense TaxID=2765364 RepID=UPI002260E264|nr:helix-turn-helix domain-containing protein [Corynebacterium marambiense]MCX7541352.1 helix-turn-helix domain-containing protein [Corynebacterium marambiense]